MASTILKSAAGLAVGLLCCQQLHAQGAISETNVVGLSSSNGDRNIIVGTNGHTADFAVMGKLSDIAGFYLSGNILIGEFTLGQLKTGVNLPPNLQLTGSTKYHDGQTRVFLKSSASPLVNGGYVIVRRGPVIIDLDPIWIFP